MPRARTFWRPRQRDDLPQLNRDDQIIYYSCNNRQCNLTAFKCMRPGFVIRYHDVLPDQVWVRDAEDRDPYLAARFDVNLCEHHWEPDEEPIDHVPR